MSVENTPVWASRILVVRKLIFLSSTTRHVYFVWRVYHRFSSLPSTFFEKTGGGRERCAASKRRLNKTRMGGEIRIIVCRTLHVFASTYSLIVRCDQRIVSLFVVLTLTLSFSLFSILFY